MTAPCARDSFSDVTIHVGYHKAASTLLQRNLFVPQNGFWSPWSQIFYHQSILLDRPDRGWSGRVRAAFLPEIEAARSRGLAPALTCEALSGDMWRAGQANGYGNFHVADVLAEAFPGARVILVHREQVSMICSLYKHSIRGHWATSLDNFLDQRPAERGMAPLLNFGYLEYSWLLEHYIQRFGFASVLALPFELLRTRVDEWTAALSAFTGAVIDESAFSTGENKGISALTARAKSRVNTIVPHTADPNRTQTARLVNTLGGLIDSVLPDAVSHESDKKLKVAVEAKVGRYFREDNRRLFSVSGEDWSTFGYDAGGKGSSVAPLGPDATTGQHTHD